MKATGFKAFSLALGLGITAAFSAIPEAAHPDVDLTLVPLPAKYKTMGMAFLKDGRMVLATTDFIGGGEMPAAKSDKHKLLLITGATQSDPAKVVVEEIANTWWQMAGIVVANDKLYVSDRDGFYEITQLSKPADLKANRRLIASWPNENTWNSGTQWHQWVFTPMYRNGFFYAPYSGSIKPGGPSNVNPTSSKCGAFLKWDLAGKIEATAGGLRSPNGAGLDEATGEMYVADNEGSWLPSSTFALMKPGKFYGHSNVSSSGTTANWAESLPYEPPVAWLPHGEFRASPSEPVIVKHGPFAGDWLLGDINNPGIIRIALDRVGATPNGAAFFFTNGFKTTYKNASAINRMTYGPDSAIYIGTTKSIGGNWPSTEASDIDMQGVYRLAFKNGPQTAFEMKSVRSLKDGLEVEFTLPVNPATVDTATFTIAQQEFKRMEQYGQGEQAKQPLRASSTEVSTDGKRVHLVIPGMVANRVVHLKHSAVLKSSTGKAAWNDIAYFTHNHISTRAWSATVGIPIASQSSAQLNGLLDQRVSGPGVLSVAITEKGAWSARLISANGSMVAGKSGAGESRFLMDGGPSRSGLHFLQVQLPGGMLVRKVVF